jgi:hypothetical protein
MPLLRTDGISGIPRDGTTTLDMEADIVRINGVGVATLADLDSRRFRYLGYEKYENGIITRDRKLQQRVLKQNALTGEAVEVWEDIPTVEE